MMTKILLTTVLVLTSCTAADEPEKERPANPMAGILTQCNQLESRLAKVDDANEYRNWAYGEKDAEVKFDDLGDLEKDVFFITRIEVMGREFLILKTTAFHALQQADLPQEDKIVTFARVHMLGAQVYQRRIALIENVIDKYQDLPIAEELRLYLKNVEAN